MSAAGPLTVAFLAHRHDNEQAVVDLERLLRAACAQGRSAYPQLAVTDEVFARRLGVVAEYSEGGRSSIFNASMADLYLVCACLVRASLAAETFIAKYKTTVEVAIARVVSGTDRSDQCQGVWNDLLVGSSESGPRIEKYAGTGPLGRWIQVAAHRSALGWIRARNAQQRTYTRLAADPLLGNDAHPELIYLKQRYRVEFEGALASAIGELTDRQRFILRLHIVDGDALEKIGRMYGVRQPTVSRWLAQTRDALRQKMTAILRDRLGTSTAELDSLAALVASQIELSLPRLLRQSE